MASKQNELNEIRVGSIILFTTEEPSLPDVNTQARVVADFFSAITRRYIGRTPEEIEESLTPLRKLRDGDIAAVYRQYTEEEIEEEKARFTFSVGDQTQIAYDEYLMELRLLPIEKQLEEHFLKARAQLWGTEHGTPVLWSEWERYRKKVAVSQRPSLGELLDDPEAKHRSANTQGGALARAAVSLPERTPIEIDSLAGTLTKEMFLSDRLALPVHHHLPVQLPDRIPLWAWEQGLSVMVPFWWTLEQQLVNAPSTSHVFINTHPTADHMRTFLVTKGSELLEERRSPTNTLLTLSSRLEMPNALSQAVLAQQSLKTEQALEKINLTLLARKEEGASLLKLHLDLIDQAYRVGGTQPILRYDLREAAERLGYKRPNSRRGFDTGTLRELYSRVLTLQSCLIQAYEAKNNKKERLIGNVPYWEIRSFEQLDDGDQLGPYQILLTDKSAPVYTSLIIQPGLWWMTTQMSNFRLHVPSSILKLDTSGKGNEVNRMALKLAASLAVWERINATRFGGSSVEATVEQLLEKACITTGAALVEQGWNANRTRDALIAAIEVLREHGAFEVSIVDPDDYEATGRGWINRFLSARLALSVRALSSGKTSSTKGRSKSAGSRRKGALVQGH